MVKAKRESFLAPERRDEAALDAPVPIGEGQTMSAPHMVHMMAEALDVRPGHRVLDVGSGSGWHAAVLAHLVGPQGHVTTIEILPRLAQQARLALERAGLGETVTVVEGDGSRGHAEGAPYDRISVAAAAPAVPPPLLDQLAPDGLLVLPLGSLHVQTLMRVRKDGGMEPLASVRFVPLRGEHGWA